LLEKQNKLKYEKEADKNFALTHNKVLSKEDQDRKKFFDRLKGFQKANDAKHQMFKKYMSQDAAQLNSKKDEKAYLHHVADQEIKAAQKELNEKTLMTKKNQHNFNVLDKQIRDKEIQKLANKHQEEIIAKKIDEDVRKERKNEQQRKLQENDRKKEYFQNLSEQINENHKKKSYSMLMTDHERRMNDNDIKAYENIDTKNLYSMVPGFDSYNTQQNYIDKSMRIDDKDGVNIGQKAKLASKGATINRSLSKPSQRFQKGLAENIKLNNTLAKNKGGRLLNEFSCNPQKLQKVIRNMEIVDRENLRGSTINKSYGQIKVKL